MKIGPTYTVIGVRPNGDRVVLASHASGKVADKAVNMIQAGCAFREVRIETNDDNAPASMNSTAAQLAGRSILDFPKPR